MPVVGFIGTGNMGGFGAAVTNAGIAAYKKTLELEK